MPRSFDRIKPGLVIDRQTAATLNRALELLEALSLPRSTGEVGLVSRPGGIAVSDQRPFPETWWVSIDGPGVTSQRYEDWTRLEDQGDGTFAAAGDDSIGGPTFPGFLPPGWPIPAAGSVAMAVPASDGESLLLLTPPASSGTSGHPVTVTYGPFISITYLGPSTTLNFSAVTLNFVSNTAVNFDSTTIVNIAGSVTITGPVCWDHYPLWDVFEDTLHASPVADYAGSVKPWWRLNFDASDPEWEISGLVALPETCEGAEHVLTNTAAAPLVLLHEDAGSAAANRFDTPDGLPFPLLNDESAWVRYDRTLSRWRVLYRLPPVMEGATSGAAGAAGLVPEPAAGDDVHFLRGDGTWQPTLEVKGIAGAPDYTGVSVLVIDNTSTNLQLSSAGAGSATLSVPTADAAHSGCVSTTAQAFSGRKHFLGNLDVTGTDGLSLTDTAGTTNYGRVRNGLPGTTLAISAAGIGFDGGSNTTPAALFIVDATGTLRAGGTSDGTLTGGLLFTAGLYTGGTSSAARPVDDSGQILSGIVYGP
jgi:hypothetical protein